VILTGVRGLGLGQHPADLFRDGAGGAIGVQRGVGLHRRSVQCHQPRPDQPGLTAQFPHMEEDAPHPLRVSPPEP
jgi:hypothetical protein